MNDDDKDSFFRDIELGAEDYLRLPNHGFHYLNLQDAALLAALDHWACGADPLPPFDEVRPGQTYHPRVRAAVRPLVDQLVTAFIRSISLGELEAHILQRDFPSLQPLPERTYIHIDDIEPCMTMYGLDMYGDIVRWVREDDDADDAGDWQYAARIARRRTAFRLGVPDEQRNDTRASKGAIDDISTLRKQIAERDVFIAHLTKAGTRGPRDDRPLATRERNNLQKVVGVMLELLLPHYGAKQEALIDEIQRQYKGKDGLSESHLQRLFPKARRSLHAED